MGLVICNKPVPGKDGMNCVLKEGHSGDHYEYYQTVITYSDGHRHFFTDIDKAEKTLNEKIHYCGKCPQGVTI